MSDLKLEVGKTYLNRKGEKVKIIKLLNKIFHGWPYVADNGNSYDENGLHFISNDDDERNLIEETTNKITLELTEYELAFIARSIGSQTADRIAKYYYDNGDKNSDWYKRNDSHLVFNKLYDLCKQQQLNYHTMTKKTIVTTEKTTNLWEL